MYKTNTHQQATDYVIYFVYWFMLLLNKKTGILDAKGKANLLQHKQLVIKKVQFVFEELHIHPLEDNKAFVFHKHHSNTLKQFRLHHRHRCHENSDLILVVFLFWIVFPFLFHHLLHHIHNTYYKILPKQQMTDCISSAKNQP